MKIFSIIASWLYGMGVYLRNMLYHADILKSTSVDIATICVGNLAVGGTGKTPMIEYLVRLLSPQYKVAILSRGYKRKSKGIQTSVGTEVTSSLLGDEPMQMHLHFPEVPIVVSADRVKGVQYIQAHFPDVQVILLDDAYQHRALRCGYNILLTPESRLFVDDHLLPWGRLREHAYRANRADMVVVTKCPEKMQPIEQRNIINRLQLAPFQTLVFSWSRYEKLAPILPKTKDEGAWLFRPLVLAGIAQPAHLLEMIRSRYPKAQMLDFPDHHRFTKGDVKRISKAIEKHNCDSIITTEKDAVRLRETAEFMEEWGAKTFVLPMQVDMKNFTEIFNQNILRYVKENTRNR